MEVNTVGDDGATDSVKSPNFLLPPSTAAAIDLLSRRWILQVLYLLCQVEARFSELARAVPGLSRRVLTERLRELADQGLVRRIVEDGPPTRIIYCLTEQGAALRTALDHIDVWASTHHPVRAS
ncbi:helix-turn-helix domain-containing protein [Streptosporangium canum]|uniref:winged helix-turn-helix transcriptional regulator n=1 Tax=Streptosporangium canum TaxID=324952 RepID=UPI003417E7D8